MRASGRWLGVLLSLSAARSARAQDALGPLSELQPERVAHQAALLAEPEQQPSAEREPDVHARGAESEQDVAAQGVRAHGSAREQSEARSGARGHKRARHTTERQRRVREDSAGSAKYDELKRSWHEPWSEPDDQAIAGSPALVLHPVGKTATPYVLLPNGDQGGFGDEQLAVAGQAFGSWEGGPKVSQRLLDLVYHAVLHFGVAHVHLVSGVRHDRGGSRHSHGLAADIVLPGVSDEELAGYFRAQGFVGVGVYTRSGFVHVDVRDRSFFWIDPSPPDKHYKIRPVRAEEAKAADEAALARGQDSFVNPPKLQKALRVREKLKRKQALSQASAN